jgi:hypothetical protein
VRALAVVLVLLSACAARRAAPPRAPVDVEPESFAVPEVAADWQGAHVETGQPVPIGGGRAAVLLSRRAGDRHEVAVAVGRREGPAALVPVASVDVAGSRREVHSSLTTMTVDGERLLRADVRVFENVEPGLFAVKSAILSSGDEPLVVLDRIVESGDDVRDRRAALAARDVDGDGAQELVIEERESGNPAPRTLVYRRGPDGRFTTDGASIFAQ